MSEDPETPDSDPDLVADADADGTPADGTDDADEHSAESERSEGSATGNDEPEPDADGWTAWAWTTDVVDANDETGAPAGTGDEAAETGRTDGDATAAGETEDERAGTGATGRDVEETAGAADEATGTADADDETADTADAADETSEAADADGWTADVWTAEVVDPDDETSGAETTGDDASASGETVDERGETTDADGETGASAGAGGVTAETGDADGMAAGTGSPDGEVAEPMHADAPAVEDPSEETASVTPDPNGSVAETGTDDGVVGSGGEVAGDPPPDDVTVADFGRGPEDDVEMPLADHIEEMIRRLGIVFLIGGVVAIAVFPLADGLINYLWNSHIPGAATVADRRPRLYGPLELLVTELKVAGLAGLIAGLPVLVYQSYRFMRPGLYPNERRYYLAAVPTSLVLATVGVSFAHFVVLPAIFAYFTSYTTGTALVAFGLRETFNLILLLMGYMAVVFQIPLFIMLAIMMGLATRRSLEDKRLLFWGGFAGLSFLVSPDPTGMAPIIVTATMIALFEGTLALLRWTGN